MKIAIASAVVGATALLHGCAQPKVMSASERSVVIRTPVMTQAAQDMADAQCARYGRRARLISRANVDDPQAVFDCVP